MQHVQSNNNTKFLYTFLPALPVILGAAAIVWQHGAGLYGVIAGVVLVFCGVGGGLFLWSRHVTELARINAYWAEDENRKMEAVVTYTNELERLLLTITPILSQHVMASREHTEQEVISLTNRFADMVTELQQIVSRADDALNGQQHYHLDNVIGTSRALLQPILESLKQIHQVEHQATVELHKLSPHIEGLSSSVIDVHKLVGQLNALAADGAEAEDLRQLADESAQTDQQLAVKVNDIVTAVNAALATADSSILVDDSTLYQAEDNVKQTLAHLTEALAHYRNDVEVLRNNAEQVRSEINNVLVAFQFQDRVSQILTQVENNLLNLQETIEKIQQQGSERNGTMLQVDEAVEHIEENYKSVSSRPNAEQDNSDDLTFF
ncbi:MAG: hypothetical protein Q7U38_13005 [Methylobacter sp.]|nr:hypothetical protein [Methylobacter sp.]MDP2099159.1 hypothetical protein [Methylobacter sp.]MDP2429985.1 hypothetical protein [Methylobacter sp.]MDP3054830.1 hypothetical protein [Methylobacter sp.]MDP3361186.1 hypothetical protein [Methylobacter sp.]